MNLELIDDEEEVLLALAESLSNFVDYVGGPAYAPSLLPPLEALSRASDSSTRDKVNNKTEKKPEACEVVLKMRNITMKNIKKKKRKENYVNFSRENLKDF